MLSYFMPNPRFMSKEGEPSVDLLMRLYKAKKVYLENLSEFCKKEHFEKGDLEEISEVYLIGSHASEDNWMDETSDIDFALVMPLATPQNLFEYKRKVLNPILCASERKRDWVDLYFLRQDYQITDPKFKITKAWKDIKLENKFE